MSNADSFRTINRETLQSLLDTASRMEPHDVPRAIRQISEANPSAAERELKAAVNWYYASGASTTNAVQSLLRLLLPGGYTEATYEEVLDLTESIAHLSEDLTTIAQLARASLQRQASVVGTAEKMFGALERRLTYLETLSTDLDLARDAVQGQGLRFQDAFENARKARGRDFREAGLHEAVRTALRADCEPTLVALAGTPRSTAARELSPADRRRTKRKYRQFCVLTQHVCGGIEQEGLSETQANILRDVFLFVSAHAEDEFVVEEGLDLARSVLGMREDEESVSPIFHVPEIGSAGEAKSLLQRRETRLLRSINNIKASTSNEEVEEMSQIIAEQATIDSYRQALATEVARLEAHIERTAQDSGLSLARIMEWDGVPDTDHGEDQP